MADPEIPAELAAALARRPGLREAFDGFSLAHRREYLAWVGSAKKPETRAKRAEEAVAMMLERGGPGGRPLELTRRDAAAQHAHDGRSPSSPGNADVAHRGAAKPKTSTRRSRKTP